MALKLRRFRRDELENDLNKGALWAVTYGDLMSYLMIFFLILFAASLRKPGAGAVDQKKYHESLVNIQKVFGGQGSSRDLQRAVNREKEESMVQQLKEDMNRKQLSAFAKVEVWDKKVRLVLSDAVLFDSGSATLKPSSREILAAVVAQLKGVPNALTIEGHTDSVPVRGGRYSSNWELSMARAYAVLRMMEGAGIASSRLSGVGYGEHRPKAPNDTTAGRANNRRIEIDIVRED